MDYRPPMLRLYQQFEDALAGGAQPLYPVVIGSAYAMHRYSEESERAEIGAYDKTQSNIYSWPDHVAGGVIDLTNADIVVQAARLKYFTAGTPANLLEDNGNRIKLDQNLVGPNRDASLGSRDVQVGDLVTLNYTDGSAQTIKSVVVGLEAEVVAGTTDPDMVRVEGSGSTAEGATETVASPSAYTTAYDPSNYDGLVQGYVTDNYTLQVLEVGTGGTGLLNGTKIKITSENGDTPSQVELNDTIWNGSAYEFALGTRGATATIVYAGAGTVAVGDSWSVVISQDYQEIDASNSADIDVTGPYVGSVNTQYILTVLQGGVLGTDDLIIKYSTNNGQDVTGNINALAADFTGASVAYAFGNKGMTLTLFDTKAMRTGDVFTFDVEAQGTGETQTIVIRDIVPTTTAVDIDVDLLVSKDIVLSEVFRTLTQDDITVAANATYNDDILGYETAHVIEEGTLFADYRERRTLEANSLGFVSDAESVLSKLGPVTQDNPLSQGTFDAARGAVGTGAYYIAVETEDLAGYARALEILTENRAVYSLCPLTEDKEILDLTQAHIESRSSEENNQWRIGWFGNNTTPDEAVYTEAAGGGDLEATVLNDNASKARVVTSAGALFATNGVSSGDILRINYDYTDPANPTYEEYVIDYANENEIYLLSFLPAEITVAHKIEIHRVLDNAAYAQKVGEFSARFASRRIRSVYADGYIEADGTPKKLMYLACYLGGVRASVAPHAPLSNVALSGIEIDPVYKFGSDDLNIMGAAGTWIVVKDFEGVVSSRHQLTTYQDPTDVKKREDNVTTNVDHISRELYLAVKDLYGQGNISPDMLALISTRIKNTSLSISGRSYPAELGPQLLNMEIVSLGVDPVLIDTVRVQLNPEVPKPLNGLDIILTVS